MSSLPRLAPDFFETPVFFFLLSPLFGLLIENFYLFESLDFPLGFEFLLLAKGLGLPRCSVDLWGADLEWEREGGEAV